MDSVSGGGDGDVGPRVDEQPGVGAVEGVEQGAGEAGELACGQVFFAELEEVDAIGCERGGLFEERGGLGLLIPREGVPI